MEKSDGGQTDVAVGGGGEGRDPIEKSNLQKRLHPESRTHQSNQGDSCRPPMRWSRWPAAGQQGGAWSAFFVVIFVVEWRVGRESGVSEHRTATRHRTSHHLTQTHPCPTTPLGCWSCFPRRSALLPVPLISPPVLAHFLKKCPPSEPVPSPTVAFSAPA
jgi:hypothetical protein